MNPDDNKLEADFLSEIKKHPIDIVIVPSDDIARNNRNQPPV